MARGEGWPRGGRERDEELGKGGERLPPASSHSQRLVAKGLTARVFWKRESFLGELLDILGSLEDIRKIPDN